MSSTILSIVILKTECEGKTYKLVTKGQTCCLVENETKLLWWGDVAKIPNDAAPLEVILKLSLLHREALT